MIELPSNVTTATLALILGLALGIGGTLYFSSSPSTLLTRFEQEGLVTIDRDRNLAPRDTAGQEEPRVEIRYDTVRVRDTIAVGVPQSLTSGAVVSDRTPLELTSSRVTHTYWDPRDSRWEQRVYAVPQDNLELSAYVLAKTHTRLRDVSPRMGRVWLGPRLELRYRRLTAGVELTTTPLLSRQRLTVGLQYEL